MKRNTLGAAFLVLLVFLRSAVGQVPTGTPPFGSFGGGPFDIVNLGNLNVHFAIPIIQKAGRGSSYSYNISYDTSVWYPVGTSGSQTWTPAAQYGLVLPAASGWLTYQIVNTYQQPCNPPNNMTMNTMTVYAYFVYHEINGTSHPFNDSYVSPYIQGCISGSQYPSTGVAADGSGYTISVGGSPFVSKVTAPDGTVYNLLTSVNSKTDANGNQITESTSGTITDTLGQTVLTTTGTNPLHLTYTAPSGGSASYVVNYTSQNIKTNFGCSGITEYSANSVPLVSSIVLPDNTSYTFTYEPTPGHSGYTTARLTEVTLPTGGSINYGYTGANDGVVCADGSTLGLARTLSSPGGEWTYARTPVSGGHWQTTVSSPPDPVNSGNASDVTVIDFQQDGSTTYSTYNFYETQRKVYQGSAAGTPLETLTTCYNAHYANCVTTSVSSPITQTDRYRQLGNSTSRLSEVTYDSTYGRVTDDKEYTYGVATGTAPGHTDLVRETAITYASLGNGIYNKPASVIIYDWSSGSQVTLSSATYGYDQTSVTATSGTPQHVSVSGSRGNLTTATVSTSTTASLNKTFSYYDTGTPNVVTDVNSAQTTYVYGSGSCGNSFATTINEPLSLSRSITWNCAGGVATKVTDENGNSAIANYTDPDFWRPANVYDEENNETTFTYIGRTAVETALQNFNGGNSVLDSRTTVDGFGRAIFSQRLQGPGATNYDTGETDYNIMGQPYRSTMPYSATASPSSSNTTIAATSTAFDALGRPTSTTDSDGGTVSYTYTNNDVLQQVSGGQTFQKQFEYDGLGRLTSVCEISSTLPGIGTCAQGTSQSGYWTKYTYDALGRLLTVKQNAQAVSGSQQTRAFAYDRRGRMLTETNPESGTKTYVYDSDSTMCGNGASTSNGNLVKTTDAAGNCVMYYYDALHRVTDVGNSNSNPCRRLRYDKVSNGIHSQPSGSTLANLKGRLTEASTDNCASPFSSITDEWFNYDNRGELTDVYESTPHSSGFYHSTAAYWPNGLLNTLGLLNSSGTALFPSQTYSVDAEGRPNLVSAASGQNPVTSVSYSTGTSTAPLGALTGVTFGSADSDAFTYDPNTGRMATYKFTVNSKTDLGTLTWNSNGTLAALSITDQIPSTSDSQSCTYGYDDVRRISNVTCGTFWVQNFTYDAFGNIKKNVPNGDGGLAFLPTYWTAPPTNQFSSLPGVSVQYDSDGNLLTDNLNTYTWDAYGDMTTVSTGSATVTSTYDAMGRMVENNAGGSYTEFVYGPTGKLAKCNGQTLVKAFVALPGGAKAIYNSSGLAYYRHSDWLGSSRLTSTATTPTSMYSSSAYAPFGEQYGTAGSADASFTGQDQDTVSNLYDFMARRQSPSQGRWISPDPLGRGAAKLTNPQSWNRYAYVLNNPLALVDPTGLDDNDGCSTEYDDATVTCGVGRDGPDPPSPTTQGLDDGGGGGGGNGNNGGCQFDACVTADQPDVPTQDSTITCNTLAPNAPPGVSIGANASQGAAVAQAINSTVQAGGISSAQGFEALTSWMCAMFCTGGLEDYKNNTPNGQLYVELGNVNYGAVCGAVGYSLAYCQSAAGAGLIGRVAMLDAQRMYSNFTTGVAGTAGCEAGGDTCTGPGASKPMAGYGGSGIPWVAAPYGDQPGDSESIAQGYAYNAQGCD